MNQEVINALRISWETDKKSSEAFDNEGNTFLLYWDDYNYKWTIEPLAFKGYVISRLLNPIDFYSYFPANQAVL